MKTLKNYVCLSLVACGVCFMLTGCGTDDNGSTSGNNDNNVVEDVAENVGDAAEDVTDGVGNAVDDLVGDNGFDNYDDAHNYFLETMGNYHSDAQFEIRDEDRNLTDYQEGSKGYRFNLYDTSKNTDGDLFGEFYVDSTSGTIYQKDAEGNFTEYRGTDAANTDNNPKIPAEDATNNNENGNNTTDGAANNNTDNGNKKTSGAANNNAGNGNTNSGNVSSAK